MNDEAQWRSLANAISREVTHRFPEWTESNDSDPGTTLLELFAWLAEQLLYTQSMTNPPTLNQRGVRAARRLAAAASSFVSITCDADSETPLRVNYFDGQLLRANDFLDEQTYFRQRLRLLNRRLHGTGVVSGLKVSIKGSGNAAHIEISPGVAIDPTGEEIVLRKCATAQLPLTSKELYVQIRWLERPCMPVATIPDSEPTQYSRISDTWETLVCQVAAEDAVTLAHLKRVSGRWTIGKAKSRRKAST